MVDLPIESTIPKIGINVIKSKSPSLIANPHGHFWNKVRYPYSGKANIADLIPDTVRLIFD